jgi:hypothetical protein
VASEISRHAVYDVQVAGHWDYITAPCGTEFREQEGNGVFPVRWHTNSTPDSACISIADVVSEWSHAAMFSVTVWFGGIGNPVLVRDPVSLAFFLTQILPGLKPFMKEYEFHD